MNKYAQSIVDSLIQKNEEGYITSMDFDTLNETVSQLVKARKEIREQNAAIIKARKDAENAVKAEAGKAYYDALPVGGEFQYKLSDGSIMEATKIETKSKTGLTAACELVNPPEDAKTSVRYPKFWQVVVPAEDTPAED
jgi:hypothetical protein